MIPGQPASILITDDESNIRLLLRTALETEGYAVSEAGDGRAALDIIRHQRPNLMVLDLNMPVLDGMAVLEQLKQLAATERPRVIVLTAYGSISTAVRATRLGASDFLEKPVTPGELRSVVRGVLEEPDPLPLGNEIPPAGEYEHVLHRVRQALRLVKLDDAQTLLAAAAERKDEQAAAYFNLLGILYESQHRWRLARRCYGKAIKADPTYEPARTNDSRLEEKRRLGYVDRPVTLGDEPDDAFFAHMPTPPRHY